MNLSNYVVYKLILKYTKPCFQLQKESFSFFSSLCTTTAAYKVMTFGESSTYTHALDVNPRSKRMPGQFGALQQEYTISNDVEMSLV